MSEYGYQVEVPEGYDEAIVRTRLAMKREGFSIITEAHVGGMLGPEAGAERQYLIMGVWSPTIEERRIGSDLQVAVHLPCNVVVQESSAGAVVAALDPGEDYEEEAAMPADVMEAVRSALNRVLVSVGGVV